MPWTEAGEGKSFTETQTAVAIARSAPRVRSSQTSIAPCAASLCFCLQSPRVLAPHEEAVGAPALPCSTGLRPKDSLWEHFPFDGSLFAS